MFGLRNKMTSAFQASIIGDGLEELVWRNANVAAAKNEKEGHQGKDSFWKKVRVAFDGHKA